MYTPIYTYIHIHYTGSDFDELGGHSCDIGDPFYDPSRCLSGGADDLSGGFQNGQDPTFSIEEEL